MTIADPQPVLDASLLLAELDFIGLLKASKGFILIVVLAQIALVVLTFFTIIYKVIQLSQAQSQSVTFLDRFWESKRLDDIYRVAEGLKYSPLGTMFKAGYIELSKIKKGRETAAAQQQGSMHDRMSEDTTNIERALQRARVSETTKLETLQPFLATIGAASPFIGLFGTVWGIMEAFMKIAEMGSAELSQISQPIAEALGTTALGLISAVPAVIAFNYFNRRIKVLVSEMTTFGNDYINIIRRHFF